MDYEAVIGLEIHAQLKTKSKIFCNCSTEFGAQPNSQTCPVCAGFPGVLPVLNIDVVKFAVKAGLAMNCKINNFSKFDRKNYFYPDLPKAYQISQFDKPLCLNGFIDIEVNDKIKRIGITRIHIEEDAGKLIHSSEDFSAAEISYADYNRCGVPLIEIVSEPDMRLADEAFYYMQTVKNILEYIEVSDCNMQEGSLRCDANVSIRPKASTKLGTKTELKNMNSFKNVKDALEYEIQRQIKELELGGKIIQQTRFWDTKNNVTVAMRTKEESHDYRYFSEPDLMPLDLNPDFITEIKNSICELPFAKKNRFVKEYNIPDYDARVLTSDRKLAEYYEETVKLCKNYKSVSNWIMTELLAQLNEKKMTISDCKISPQNFAKLIELIDTQKISGKIAKEIFPEIFASGANPEEIVNKKGLVQVSDEDSIKNLVIEVIKENRESVLKYKNGQTKILGFLVGQAMKKSMGKANPQLVNKLFIEELAN